MREGLLLINKPKGRTSFHLIRRLRKLTGIRRIGHAGTLDPFATGVMVLLVGRSYTRLSDTFLHHDKEYRARLRLGITTDTYDATGEPQATSDVQPLTIDLAPFQGGYRQTPPMFSAKKIQGQKLYALARRGITVERAPVEVKTDIELLSYAYPYVELQIRCSKGTYIRSLAHDLGQHLGCGAHLEELCRTRSGPFPLANCVDGELLEDPTFAIESHLQNLAAPA